MHKAKTNKKFFLSVHIDNVFDELKLSISNGQIKGTLDNFIGVSSMLSYPILKLINTYNIPIHFTHGEEIDGIGAHLVASNYSNEEWMAIVVDVAPIGNYDISIENISGFDGAFIDELKEDYLKFNDYKPKIKYFTGNPDETDEAWAYRSEGFDTMTFCFPVSENFHTKSCIMDTAKLLKAQMAFKTFLTFLLYKQNQYGGDTYGKK